MVPQNEVSTHQNTLFMQPTNAIWKVKLTLINHIDQSTAGTIGNKHGKITSQEWLHIDTQLRIYSKRNKSSKRKYN